MQTNITCEQLKENGWLLPQISEADRTYEICKAAASGAIKRYNYDRNIIDFVPKNFRTYEICFEVVKHDGDALRSVPEHLKDRNLCLAAVSGHGEALAYVPDNLIDREMCKIAVLESGRAWWSVSNNIRDKELALLAVRTNPIIFLYMSDDLKDEAVCLRVMRALDDICDFAPQEHIPENVWGKICCRIEKNQSS